MKPRIVFPLLLVAAVFAVYAPSLRNGFVWDDTALILADPFIRSWRLMAEGFRHFLFTDATASDFYRPLQRLSYTWDYAWFGFQPWAYHLSNIVIHAGAAVAVFLFLERLLARLGKPNPAIWAGAAAGLWAIHPLHTSAVCYISGRADLLAGLFGALGLWVAMRGTRGSDVGAALLFLCALLSKESGAIFLPLWIVLLLFLRQPLRRPAALCVCVAAVYSVLRFTAEHQAPPASAPLSWAARPIVALRALAEYAGLFLAPVRLHMERDVLPFGRADFLTTIHMGQQREFQTLLGALLVAGLVFWFRWARRSDRAVLAALSCFVLAYLPVCGLFSLNASVAEHWLYVPSIFLLAASLVSISRLPFSRSALAALLCIWGAFLGVRTFLRNDDWHDQRTFLERTIADGGGSARMLINLGALESSQGHQRIAVADYENALTLAPDQPFALLGLATAYLKERQFTAAREPLAKAIDIPLVQAEALDALAVLEYQENHADRVDLLRLAAKAAPENWQVRKRYILHLAERGQMVAAITALRDVVAEQPYRGESWRLLGDFWTHVHQYDSAVRAYQKAASLDVHDDVAEQRAEYVRKML